MKTKINKHFICVVLAAILWGTAGIFVRASENYKLSEMQMVFGRTVLTALIMGIIILLKDKTKFKIKIKDLWIFVCAGLFSIVLFNYSYYTTMSLTSLSVAAVLLYTAPFFVMVFSVFLFSEKLTVNKSIACIVAFFGCCLVSGFFDSEHRVSGKALFFGLLTGIGYALYTIFGEILIKRGYSSLTITFYVFLFAGICSVIFVNPVDTIMYAVATPKAFLVVLLMAVFNTVIPYILYTTGLSGISPSTAPIIATIEPVIATIVGAVFFAEAITLSGGLGIILVLISVVILNLKKVKLRANAKINLSLAVCGRREDGYHFIDTVIQSVSIADKIIIKPSDTITVKCDKDQLSGENNIAYKAAVSFFEASKIKGGAEIIIKKNIPEAAGLGGGSADAAAVLLGLNRLYEAKLSHKELEVLALKLGADVPFFIKGGTQRAEGIGDQLTVLKPFKKGYFLLVKDGEKPSTAQMYKKIDSETLQKINVAATVEAINNNDVQSLKNALGNSFAIIWKDSDIEQELKRLSDAVSLSGSGPTWFGYFSTKKAAKKASDALKAKGKKAYITRPLKKSIYMYNF